MEPAAIEWRLKRLTVWFYNKWKYHHVDHLFLTSYLIINLVSLSEIQFLARCVLVGAGTFSLDRLEKGSHLDRISFGSVVKSVAFLARGAIPSPTNNCGCVGHPLCKQIQLLNLGTIEI